MGYADRHIYAWQGAPSTWTGGGDDLARYEEIAVGGILIPVDKLGLLAHYIVLASTIVVAAVATAIYSKCVKRRKEKR